MPEDPLANLKDLHLPEPAAWWPPAPGWWLLLLLLCLSPLLWRAWKRWRTRHTTPVYRNAALEELQQYYRTYQQQQNGTEFVQSVSALLKRVALQCYDREEVASLSGAQWGEFLGRQQGEQRKQEITQLLATAHSQQVNADIEFFFRFAREWIEAQEAF